MAHHKSAVKRTKQNEKRNARNRALRSSLRTHLKKYRVLLQGKNAQEAEQGLGVIQMHIDKAVTKGILHRNAAARYKSRLATALKKVVAA